VKLIALMPVRNEAHILPATLACLEQFCDHIILSDHQSTDNTKEIARSFTKVILIDNTTPQTGAEHGRPALFEAARQFEGNNLLLCLDADEIAPPAIFQGLKAAVAERFEPGTFFTLWWVQLWRGLTHYRADESVWSNSYVPMMLYDDRRQDHWGDRHFLHGGRLPTISDPTRLVKLEGFPVLHLQWAYWDRTQFKQARYRMLEYIQAEFANTEAINAKYAITLGDEYEGVAPVPTAWLEGVHFPADLMNIQPCWQYDDVLAMLERHGIARFEPLQIWHIPELNSLFVKSCGRAPYSKTTGPGNGIYAKYIRRMVKRVLPATVVSILRAIVRR
jgi:glycosyltransferase involved in cell wall biosynthesis